MDVAGAHGEAILLPDHGAQGDLRAQLQVRDHAPDQDRLLEVLAAEDRHVGASQAQELRHHGEHSPEVSGPVGAAEALGHRAGIHSDPGLTVGIDDPRVPGREDQVHPPLPGLLHVPLQIPGIGDEVLVGPELGGIHEDREDRRPGSLPGQINEGKVSLVQVSHGGHQGHVASGAAKLPQSAGELVPGPGELHASLSKECSWAG